jgi:hypothetical protein
LTELVGAAAARGVKVVLSTLAVNGENHNNTFFGNVSLYSDIIQSVATATKTPLAPQREKYLAYEVSRGRTVGGTMGRERGRGGKSVLHPLGKF